MTSTSFIANFMLGEQKAKAKEMAALGKDMSQGGKGKGDIYNVLFFLLLTAMDIRQSTVIIKSKQLSNNADLQQRLNDADEALHADQIPLGAKTATIKRIEAQISQVANERENIQNQLISARQDSQVTMTITNSDVNYVEQDASMDSGWLKTLMSIFQVINQISQRGS